MLLGKIARRRFRRFLALANDDRRLGLRDEFGQVVERPMVRPSLKSPAIARRTTKSGRNVFLAVRLIPAADIEGGFAFRRRIAP